MQKIKAILIISCCLIGLLSCNKNEKSNISPENKDVGHVIKTEDTIPNKQLQSISFQEEENLSVKNPLALYKEYSFEPFDNIDLNLVSITLEEDNNVNFIYDNNLILKIEDIDFKIRSVLNQCVPYNSNRLFSSSFHLDTDNKLYYGIISFKYGLVKIFEWLPKEKLIGWPYYSGNSQYFIIEHDWIIKPESHDALTYKLIPAVYGGNILVYDIEMNNIVYNINSKKIHEEILLSIDKIQYEDDGFRITLGNYHDSDEFTDFKLYTADNDFHYEIYDTYSYSETEE